MQYAIYFVFHTHGGHELQNTFSFTTVLLNNMSFLKIGVFLIQKVNHDCIILYDSIEYEIFGEGSQISTNQKRESTVLSEARKQCFLASDWLKFETLPR